MTDTPVTVEQFQAKARKHGLCVPRTPRHVNVRGFRYQNWYCEATGKRIRETDGYCNGCVAWGT